MFPRMRMSSFTAHAASARVYRCCGPHDAAYATFAIRLSTIKSTSLAVSTII